MPLSRWLGLCAVNLSAALCAAGALAAAGATSPKTPPYGEYLRLGRAALGTSMLKIYIYIDMFKYQLKVYNKNDNNNNSSSSNDKNDHTVEKRSYDRPVSKWF